MAHSELSTVPSTMSTACLTPPMLPHMSAHGYDTGPCIYLDALRLVYLSYQFFFFYFPR